MWEKEANEALELLRSIDASLKAFNDAGNRLADRDNIICGNVGIAHKADAEAAGVELGSYEFTNRRMRLGAEAPPSPPATQLVNQNFPHQSAAPAYFGHPGSDGWLHANTTYVKCPWTLHMDGHVVSAILIHKKLAASLTRVLNHVWEAVGQSQQEIERLRYDVYDGSYNYRPVRGGKGLLSQHAYAAAIDFDAEGNEQHAMRHRFQNDSLIVTAFKGEGWTWGGNWSPKYVDAMHFQALRV
jgi:D-alanyl-D-alanine carboxypeptidase